MSRLKNGWLTGKPSTTGRGTHWVAIPIRDIRYPPNPRNQELLQEAAAKFQQQFKTETGDPARIIEGPWYATTTEGEILLENGRMMRPSHIYYAILDVR